MPVGYIDPHLVHPAMLDGLIHANLAPLMISKGLSSEQQQTWVPIHVAQLWISAGDSLPHDTRQLMLPTQTSIGSGTKTEASCTAIHPESGQPLVIASGLMFQPLPDKVNRDYEQPPYAALTIEWKTDPTLPTESQASELFEIPVTSQDNPADWMDELDKLCLSYIRRFLGSVTEDLRKKMAGHHVKYVSWMEHALNSNNQ